MGSSSIEKNLKEAQEILQAFINDAKAVPLIEAAGNMIVNALENGQKVISCGNGGSMCDAMHFAEELSGRFREDRIPLAAIAISDVTHITCVANDYGYENVFSRYLQGIGNRGDVLLAISTSGNSVNVINAIQAAKNKGMKVIGLTGKDGGKIAKMVDVEIRAPYSKYADRAQEIHIKVIHSLIQYVEENYQTQK